MLVVTQKNSYGRHHLHKRDYFIVVEKYYNSEDEVTNLVD